MFGVAVGFAVGITLGNAQEPGNLTLLTLTFSLK